MRYAIQIIFSIYSFILLLRIISSWIPSMETIYGFRYLVYYTDPYLNLFRKIIPSFQGIDFSPILAFFTLRVVEKILLRFIA
ncbi:MAG: YggT family protein [Chlamydiales bacterium]